ncbi:MAG: phosphohistidine phosphatase SixA [Thermodesulfobacteriota bacterium]
MFLYLVQHAQAKSKEEDPERGLTEEGFSAIRKTASYAAKIGVKPVKLLHSDKLRAVQTAEVLNVALDIEEGDSLVDGLAPLDDPGIWAENLLKETDESCMLVGHLPHLNKLSSLLLTGDPESDIIDFKNAGITCLKRGEDAAWSVEWILTPEIVE